MLHPLISLDQSLILTYSVLVFLVSNVNHLTFWTEFRLPDIVILDVSLHNIIREWFMPVRTFYYICIFIIIMMMIDVLRPLLGTW